MSSPPIPLSTGEVLSSMIDPDVSPVEGYSILWALLSLWGICMSQPNSHLLTTDKKDSKWLRSSPVFCLLDIAEFMYLFYSFRDRKLPLPDTAHRVVRIKYGEIPDRSQTGIRIFLTALALPQAAKVLFGMSGVWIAYVVVTTYLMSWAVTETVLLLARRGKMQWDFEQDPKINLPSFRLITYIVQSTPLVFWTLSTYFHQISKVFWITDYIFNIWFDHPPAAWIVFCISGAASLPITLGYYLYRGLEPKDVSAVGGVVVFLISRTVFTFVGLCWAAFIMMPIGMSYILVIIFYLILPFLGPACMLFQIPEWLLEGCKKKFTLNMSNLAANGRVCTFHTFATATVYCLVYYHKEGTVGRPWIKYLG